jgi:glucosamine-6-phosphate deaminase
MQIVLCRDAEEAAELVAARILRRLREKPDLVLGLATGSTPLGVYRRLREACARGEVSFARVHTFNLDEYLDLPAEHPQSYRTFMRTHLFAGIDIPPGQVHFPPSEGNELRARCAAFERRIAELGGIDVQLLGMGRNGHIGFNEPTSSLTSRTRVKTLAEKTLRDNARFYAPGESQPALAVTMGIGTILEAKEILLQAHGAAKAEAVREAVEGPVSSFFPASALQLHPRVGAFFDPEAASLLGMRDYYARARALQRDLEASGRL